MYLWKLVKARKARVCSHCGKWISYGEVYWGNSNSPYGFCEKHSPLSDEVRAAQFMKRGRREADHDAERGLGKIVLRPLAVKPPVEDDGALFCPRCGNPLCDTYDPRIILCHICGYNFVTVEDPAPDCVSLRPRWGVFDAEDAEKTVKKQGYFDAEEAEKTEKFTGRCASCL